MTAKLMKKGMSLYGEVLEEKNKFDHYLQQGFVIHAVREDLSGAWIELRSSDDAQVTLHILTAEARIHLSNQLLKQMRNA
jgi:hypothetical protein